MNRNWITAALVAGLLLIAADRGLAKPPHVSNPLRILCEQDGGEWRLGLGIMQVPAAEPECFPCLETCSLAMGGCLGWTIQALLGQCASADAEQLTVMPKVVRRKPPIATATEAEEQEQLEELYRRSHQLRLQSQASPVCPRPTVEESHADTTREERSLEESRREHMARRLFRIAERCRRSGDHEMAYSCYCEVELLVPNSSLGERARKHMTDCQRRLGSAEEAEPGDGAATPEETMPSSLPSSKIEIELNIFCPMPILPTFGMMIMGIQKNKLGILESVPAAEASLPR